VEEREKVCKFKDENKGKRIRIKERMERGREKKQKN
jgi:hypothetical protein